VELSGCCFNVTNLDHCVTVGGGALLAHNNVFLASRGPGSVNGNSAGGDDCIQSVGSGSVIYSNVFVGFVITNYNAGQHQDGIQTWANNLQIYGNYFFNLGNSATFIAPGGTATDITNVWIYNNVAENCAEGYCLGNNNGLQTANLHNCLIANNVLCDSMEVNYPNIIGSDCTNNWYADDIVVNNVWINSGTPTLSSSLSSSNNFTTLSPSGVAGAFVSYALPTNTATMTTNQFDFHLTASATNFIGKGASLTGCFATDKDGNVRPLLGAWDIGAYEWQEYGSISVGPPGVLSVTNQP
jgi:hypothetical protein